MKRIEQTSLNKAILRDIDIKKLSLSSSALRSLVKRKCYIRIKNGLYALINPLTSSIFANRFEIATALQDNCSIAYHTALEFHGLSNQLYSEVQVIAPKRYMPFEYEGSTYVFFIQNYETGIISIEHNSLIRVTDLERTVIDCIDRIDLAGGLDELLTALYSLTHLDENKLLMYLAINDKKFLYKKTGFFLQMLNNDLVSDSFIKVCKENASHRIDDITENKKLPKYLNHEWNLIIPKSLINLEN